MHPAYTALLERLRGPLVCPDHLLPDCDDCHQRRIDDQISSLIADCEKLLAKVALEDAHFDVDNADDDNETNEEHDV